MDRTAADVAEEQSFILSTLSPSTAQKRSALGSVLVLFVALLVTAGPLSNLQLGRIDAFVPAYATAMIGTNLITAVLLFAQFSILRARALLALANGYLFTALIVVPWLLTFPGTFAPGGLLHAGLNTTNWLYIIWHVGFPSFVIAFALLKDSDPAKGLWQRSAAAGIILSVVVIAALVCAATVLVTLGEPLLPHTMIDSVHFSPIRIHIAEFQIFWCMTALCLLWVRRRSVLDLWLMVAMCAYGIEVWLIAFPVPARFSIGWYSGRVYGLLSGSFLLFGLMYEITALYAQLLRAILAQRREREVRLMTGDAVAAALAHEVKQPLAAMMLGAETAVRWLDRASLDKAKATLQRIVTDGHRAEAVMESIRAMFKSDTSNRAPLDINELIAEALAVLNGDLQKHQISVQNGASPPLRKLIGDRIQLQQVLLNLIGNAIDSMAGQAAPRILSVKSEDQDSAIMVAVADNGKGIASQDFDRIFNPLFSTKSDGMGMGLSICRSIIESHNGRLRVTENAPRGAVFEFILPAAET